jgi:hypothetical protein
LRRWCICVQMQLFAFANHPSATPERLNAQVGKDRRGELTLRKCWKQTITLDVRNRYRWLNSEQESQVDMSIWNGPKTASEAMNNTAERTTLWKSRSEKGNVSIHLNPECNSPEMDGGDSHFWKQDDPKISAWHRISTDWIDDD